MRLFPPTTAGRARLAALVIVPVVSVATLAWYAVAMPGTSWAGQAPPLVDERDLTRQHLEEIVEALCSEIGERNAPHLEQLQAAEKEITGRLEALGLRVTRQPYRAGGVEVANLEVRLAAKEVAGEDAPKGVLVVGAHYDSILGTPGADDNASGTAVVLELARLLIHVELAHDLLLVFYTNEEPPSFQTESMGSVVHATSLAESGETVLAMISVESVGYFTEAEDSQGYPAPFNLLYPSTGNFVGFVGDLASRGLVQRCVASFRENADLPSEGLAAPANVAGVGWSDHWAYWQRGYPALMVTDTALFRNPNYHEPTDTPDTLEYDAMARLVHGLVHVIRDVDAGAGAK